MSCILPNRTGGVKFIGALNVMPCTRHVHRMASGGGADLLKSALPHLADRIARQGVDTVVFRVAGMALDP